jgi:2-succinyl-5-enolpyruvyl-6-hydroxy-3-cyclohexene-1-carboxylate synthase
MTPVNRNGLWAEIVADELVRSGLTRVCIAPGSRSTPLTLALGTRPELEVSVHLDERSAAFFALGYARASGRAAAVVCTSGTAAVNFMPAIVEAHESEVPLLVLTADRSHDLRDSGANQTIDQIRLYGSHVLWSVDVAPPEADPPAVLTRSLRTLVGRAWALAHGSPGGPVHLNFPFRKPLEPTPVAADRVTLQPEELGRPDGGPFTRLYVGRRQPDPALIDGLADVIRAHERGLIVCGPLGNTPGFAEAVTTLSRASGYPIVADALSGLRYRSDSESVVLTAYEIGGLPDGVDVVLRFGDLPTATALLNFLGHVRPILNAQVRESGRWADDTHRLTHLLAADEVAFCRQMAAALGAVARGAWARGVWLHDRAAGRLVTEGLGAGAWFDGAALAAVVQALPDDATLVIGNSLPVRQLDAYVHRPDRRLRVLGNRGASGIDGVVSTAVGIAAAQPERPTVLVIGDISFYHDLNGLLAARQQDLALVVVVLNNDGGGIFRRLPIESFEPAFTRLFLTPHGMTFEHAAAQFGFAHARAEGWDALVTAVQTALSGRQRLVVEVRTEAARDLEVGRGVREQVRLKLGVVKF